MTDKNEPAQPEDQQPIINIAGDKVALGPIRRDLIPLFQRWSNDFEVVRFLGTMEPSTLSPKKTNTHALARLRTNRTLLSMSKDGGDQSAPLAWATSTTPIAPPSSTS